LSEVVLGELVDGEGDRVLNLVVGTVAVVVADLRFIACIRIFLLEET
jgi:hypothetical protein